MRGQMALEFFFAMALAYLSVLWLVNYLNAGYDSGRFLALREEKLVAAELSGLANSACVSNLSASISAPCMTYMGRPVRYWLYAEGNWLIVNSSRAPEAAKAKALCEVYANLTEYNATLGAFEQQQMACDAGTAEGTPICVRADGTGKVGLSMGRCVS